MCGIAGSINYPLNIQKLTSDLWHRGPDEQSTYQDKELILHHHRLSIVDIAGGHQPMHYEHLTIIFNGEIYNHQDLRNKYRLKCKTNSDTETILQLYFLKGASCLDEFDGMFVIVIYDHRNNNLFIARDRSGKKPVYYSSADNKFVFASELNALQHQLKSGLNGEYVNEFIHTGWFYKNHTPYQHVFELPAGCYLTVNLENPVPDVRQWWSISPFYLQHANDTFSTALDKTDSFLHTAVKRRVESSDLEVGSFLSGGIDSSIVTAIAKQYNSRLKTFTVSFEGDYDEAPLARLVAKRYETDHHEINISYDHLESDIETILSNYGEPFYDDSAIPSYYVSREARKHLTVILNGDGGDELFGGYRRYIPFSKVDFFKSSAVREKIFNTFGSIIPGSSSKMSKLNYVKRMLDLGSVSGYSAYLRATTDIFEGYNSEVFLNEWKPDEDISKSFSGIANTSLSGLQKLMLLDFENILPSVLLVKMDIATMAHSLEGRSPLLCKELLEYVPTLKDEYKINGTQTKFLLRELAKKYLPAELINQPKRGFEPPLKQWVNGRLRAIISDYLSSADVLYGHFVKKNFVSDLLNNKANVPPEKRAKMLWLLFTLEVWYKKVFKATI